MDDSTLLSHLAASPWERQQIPVITVTEPGKWDFTDTSREDLLREIAETAIRLAEQAGAEADEVETLSMLLESIK